MSLLIKQVLAWCAVAALTFATPLAFSSPAGSISGEFFGDRSEARSWGQNGDNTPSAK